MAGAPILIFLSYTMQQFLNIRLLFQVVQARYWHQYHTSILKSVYEMKESFKSICIGF